MTSTLPYFGEDMGARRNFWPWLHWSFQRSVLQVLLTEVHSAYWTMFWGKSLRLNVGECLVCNAFKRKTDSDNGSSIFGNLWFCYLSCCIVKRKITENIQAQRSNKIIINEFKILNDCELEYWDSTLACPSPILSPFSWTFLAKESANLLRANELEWLNEDVSVGINNEERYPLHTHTRANVFSRFEREITEP